MNRKCWTWEPPVAALLAACSAGPQPVTLHLLTRWTEVEPIHSVWKQAQFDDRAEVLIASGKIPAIFAVNGVLKLAAGQTKKIFQGAFL